MTLLPRYPIYVPSKGRVSHPYTIRMFERDAVPYTVVVESEELASYQSVVRSGQILELPESRQGLIYARNWIKEHARRSGAARHWQFDDNIAHIARSYCGRRIICDAGPALAAVEDFVDRFDNVAIAGLSYRGIPDVVYKPPYLRNVHVYSATLVDNATPHRWRLRYNDDTDICLQVLAGGLCTVLINAFVIDKKVTMTLAGGNTDDLYQGDGRLIMARALERQWPGVVHVDRRYGRPQHVVNWTRFSTQLKLRPDVKLDELQPNEYGLKLVAKQPVRSERLQELQRRHESEREGSGVRPTTPERAEP